MWNKTPSIQRSELINAKQVYCTDTDQYTANVAIFEFGAHQ